MWSEGWNHVQLRIIYVTAAKVFLPHEKTDSLPIYIKNY
jgi:hypothetical protein